VVSELLREKTPMRARHIRPGLGQAVEVKAGEYLQIETLQGKQVADFVAFTLGDTNEHLSTSATRSTNANIVPRQGMTLYSNRRQGLFEIVEDTVGRHDMLYACCDPVRYEKLDAPGHPNCRQALTNALADYGVDFDHIPAPINWFMNVSILQRGELEIREPLAQKGDYVLLRALKDVVAAVSACPQDLGPTNAFNPTDLYIRVYRDAPLPPLPVMPEPEVPEVPVQAESERRPARAAILQSTAEATVVRVRPQAAEKAEPATEPK
jgi:uncharacterized protein YcgI (DUF1989 family)